MARDRLTSQGWSWHQGLIRYLDVEEAMFGCDDCRSCDKHSGELESAGRYAHRAIRAPVPHMDKVSGDKMNAMTNRELGNELDRWADARDRFPNLDSIALRVTAMRLRALEEGCDHPFTRIYRNEDEDFCQNCGAIVDEDGNTVNKWTAEESGDQHPQYLRHRTTVVQEWQSSPWPASRNDGPRQPRTACGVTTPHNNHGGRGATYCSGLLQVGTLAKSMQYGESATVRKAEAAHDDEFLSWVDADIQVGHRSTDANGDGRWWKAHEGVTSRCSHSHTGSEHVGGTVPATTHRHLIPPPTICDTRAPHAPHTFRQGSRFCTGRDRYRPALQCELQIHHEAHYWGIQQRLRCDGHGRPAASWPDSATIDAEANDASRWRRREA